MYLIQTPDEQSGGLDASQAPDTCLPNGSPLVQCAFEWGNVGCAFHLMMHPFYVRWMVHEHLFETGGKFVPRQVAGTRVSSSGVCGSHQLHRHCRVQSILVEPPFIRNACHEDASLQRCVDCAHGLGSAACFLNQFEQCRVRGSSARPNTDVWASSEDGRTCDCCCNRESCI